MGKLKYKTIKSEGQYNQYCNQLEQLLDSGKKTVNINEEMELLTLLIEKWDEEPNTFKEVDPIRLLHSLLCKLYSE